jgi:hypothetical protein
MIKKSDTTFHDYCVQSIKICRIFLIADEIKEDAKSDSQFTKNTVKAM